VSHPRSFEFFHPTLSLSESFLHSGVVFISPLRGVGDQTLQVWGELLFPLSFCFHLRGVANLPARLRSGESCGRSWLSFRQCFFSFV
jgi:hypothetical protein